MIDGTGPAEPDDRRRIQTSEATHLPNPQPQSPLPPRPPKTNYQVELLGPAVEYGAERAKATCGAAKIHCMFVDVRDMQITTGACVLLLLLRVVWCGVGGDGRSVGRRID